MIQDMQHRDPKFQQQIQQPLIHQGGRKRGGRHDLQRRNYRRNQSDEHLQCKRKRGPSDEVRDTSRFYLPSFLEDPWKALEAGKENDREQEGDPQTREKMNPRQVRHYSVDGGLGRVLFQPSFLDDPWVR
ncbi:unnamed protein product [Peronospora destructor]|uniref:Uncharacterized protein n=1 Tax=Peronospora destructor TaxID=86335 RepID=A0AAV0UH29_9STRA|nr:unnamed protein product [Peronospora destructor]